MRVHESSLRAGFLAVLALCLIAAPAWSTPYLAWRIAPADSLMLASPSTFGVFESRANLELIAEFTNEESDDPIRLLPGFIGGVKVGVISDAGLSMANLTPARAVVVTDQGDIPTSVSETVTLQPGEQLRVTYAFDLASTQPLPSGRYTVVVRTADAASFVRTSANEPWSGAFASDGTITIDIRPPQSPAEQIAWLVAQGNAALNRGTAAQALQQFNRAIALSPSNAEARMGRAATYLELRRYREALDDLGPFEATVQRERSILPTMLAKAYLGLGDRARAKNALRASMSDRDADETLEKLSRTLGAR